MTRTTDTPSVAPTLDISDGDGLPLGGSAAQRSEHADPCGEAAQAGGPEGVPLDIQRSNCWGKPDEGSRRRSRWAARVRLWETSLLVPVRCCGRFPAVMTDADGEVKQREAVELRARMIDGRRRAGYGGLMTCGSPWSCPRCSAMIAVARAGEIGNAVAACQHAGGTAYMITLTLRHRASDQLVDLWQLLRAGWRSTFGSAAWTGRKARRRRRSGSTWWEPATIGDRDRFGVGGYVRAVESTLSRPGFRGHGWHLHIHALLFLSDDAGDGLRDDVDAVLTRIFGRAVAVDREWVGRTVLLARIAERWGAGVERAGGRAPLGGGLDIRPVTDGGAEYLGSYLTKSTYDSAWSIGDEIAGATAKDGRGRGQITPFELLGELVEENTRYFTRTAWVVSELPTLVESAKPWAEQYTLDTSTGELTPLLVPDGWARWHEWELATRGHRQIEWSRGRDPWWRAVLEARGRTADETDEEIADSDLGGIILGEISRASWLLRMTRKPLWLTQLLDVVERDGAAAAQTWAADRGIDYSTR